MNPFPRGPERCPLPGAARSDAEVLSRPDARPRSGSAVGADLEAALAEDASGVREEVARALEERALLLDPDRVALRAHALLVRVDRGAEPPEACPREQAARAVRQSLEQLVEEEASDLWSEPDPAPDDNFSRFAVSLGLDADSMAVARARFHALDLATRRAFLHLVLKGRPLDALSAVEERWGTLRRAREALEVFRTPPSAPADPCPPPTHPAP